MHTKIRTVLPFLLIILLSAASLYLGITGLRDARNAVVLIKWKTASELNTAGFNLYRSNNYAGPFNRINSALIPASPDSLAGGEYRYQDRSVTPGEMYFYQLEDIDLNGGSSRSDPIQVLAKPGGTVELILAGVMAIAAVVDVALYNHRRRELTLGKQ